MNTLEQWTAVACTELGLDPDVADTAAVLDLARDVAHSVARPAAPLTAYLLGVAVGRGHPVAETAARLSVMAQAWDSANGAAKA
ncbi:MAG TPA: DUF6457 domain-containing protein [Streptosporangiaceae bacterium]|nr:DUF6457 domain-containing protein [Streptosporangiaceae bacterium]